MHYIFWASVVTDITEGLTYSRFPHKIGLFPTPYTTKNKSIEEKYS